ncbi:MAG: hypothetical protein K2N30_03530, partial [Clostridia bacterium]|nr:hypothetical protein [Clostridia bacterium]
GSEMGIRDRYISGFIGKTLEFIAEEREGEYITGYTGNYVKIYAPADIAAGKKYKVELTRIYKDGALAKLV